MNKIRRENHEESLKSAVFVHKIEVPVQKYSNFPSKIESQSFTLKILLDF